MALRPKASFAGSRARDARRDKIDDLIHQQPDFLLEDLRQLRYEILCEGLQTSTNGECRYRNYVWTILLQVNLHIDSCDYYSGLVKGGPSTADAKIRSDSFRTMATDEAFKARVSENSLLRVLNAYVRHDQLGYVQGMNVLAAPFLYVSRSESQSFALFTRFIADHCPLYVVPDLTGVHTGVKLVNLVLELTDRPLYRHLKSKMLSAEIYAFPSVMTFSACTPPLSEVLNLWDLYLAYGCHLNIVSVVAQVIEIREKLMASQQPVNLLRKMPPLKARDIKTTMLAIFRYIPAPLWDLIRRHARDVDCAAEVDAYIRARNRARR